MILSEEGKIVRDEICEIPTYNKRIYLDEWVIMPNHIVSLEKYDFDNGLLKRC